jgi:hypothetical protein
MTETQAFFPETYEASRERLHNDLSAVQAMWPKTRLFQRTLPGDEDLTIDWIYSDATERNEKVVMLTTGEHGVECYVGSAMLQRFIEVYMPKLDPQTTGILLLHAINPWGMKHHRRGNADNIDLNRTFLCNMGFDQTFNSEYDGIDSFLNPPSKLTDLFLSDIAYYLGLVWHIGQMGLRGFDSAQLLGQYRQPKGLFYGGRETPEETQTLMGLYRQMLGSYEQVLHLDMHTGYGPRYQMSLVNSALDKRTSSEFVKRFDYPLVVAATADEFYALRGDMIDYIYALQQNEFPQTKLYATSFEFGTYGNSLHGLIHSPRVMIHENRTYWHGAGSDKILVRAKHGFEELFNPAAKDWREKAVADADRAFSGILRAEGFI